MPEKTNKNMRDVVESLGNTAINMMALSTELGKRHMGFVLKSYDRWLAATVGPFYAEMQRTYDSYRIPWMVAEIGRAAKG
jgi:hypothetical protein